MSDDDLLSVVKTPFYVWDCGSNKAFYLSVNTLVMILSLDRTTEFLMSDGRICEANNEVFLTRTLNF